MLLILHIFFLCGWWSNEERESRTSNARDGNIITQVYSNLISHPLLDYMLILKPDTRSLPIGNPRINSFIKGTFFILDNRKKKSALSVSVQIIGLHWKERWMKVITQLLSLSSYWISIAFLLKRDKKGEESGLSFFTIPQLEHKALRGELLLFLSSYYKSLIACIDWECEVQQWEIRKEDWFCFEQPNM